MSDDLSALVAALARHRRAGAQKGVEEAPAWLGQLLEDDAHERYVQFRGQLFQHPDLKTMRQMLLQYFPDPSDAVLVIRMCCDDEDISHATKAKLRQIEGSLLDESPQATRAGINVAQRAAMHAKKLHSHKKRAGITARALRQTYRSFLEKGDEVADQYEEWIDEYGFSSRGHVVDFLESALATDMYALDPSCARLEFGNVMRNMRKLCVVRSADDVFLRDVWSQDTMTRLGVQEETLVISMFAVVRRAGSFAKLFTRAFERSGLALSLREKAVVLQRLRRAVGNIPHELWEDEARQEAVADELDGLISKLFSVEPGTAAGIRVR